AERRMEHRGDAESGEMPRLAGRRAADGVPGALGELHVRDRFGKAVQGDQVVPGGGTADDDMRDRVRGAHRAIKPHAGGEDAEASLRDTDRMVRVEREQALGLEIAHDALRGALRILEIGAEPLVDLLGVGTVDLLGEQMTSGGQDPSDLARTDRLMAGHDQVDRLIGDGHRLAGLGVVDQHLHAPRTSPRLGTHARLTRPDRPPGYGPSPRMADSAASPLVIQHLFNLIRNLVQEDLETGLLEGEVAAARKHHDPGLAAKPTKVVEAELRHSPTILGRVQQHDRWSLVLLGWNSRTRLE